MLLKSDPLWDYTTSTCFSTLNNYAKWHLVWKLLPVLSHEFSDVYYSFYKLLTGQPVFSPILWLLLKLWLLLLLLLCVTDDKEPPRYKICVNMIQQQLPLALARTFTDEYFSPEAEVSGRGPEFRCSFYEARSMYCVLGILNVSLAIAYLCVYSTWFSGVLFLMWSS